MQADKSWEFGYWDEDGTRHEDGSHVQSVAFDAPTIEEACDKMVSFIRDRPTLRLRVDYEAVALHVNYYDPQKHEETFPNLSLMREHAIHEYID